VLGVHTNMVFISFDEVDVTSIATNLRAKNILMTPGQSVRLVTHLDLNDEDVDIFVTELGAALQ
jgi:threonine aldolase